MKSVKTVLLTGALLFFAHPGFSQLRLPGSGGLLANDLEKIVSDYPNNFRNITGELIQQNPQSADYQSTVQPKGAEACIVTEFPSSKRNHYSWQACLFTSEEFAAAAKKFKSAFGQINNLLVKSDGQEYRFAAGWQVPVEEKRFNSIVFETDAQGPGMGKLKIELSLENILLEWKIKLIVYEKEREDDERGERLDG